MKKSIKNVLVSLIIVVLSFSACSAKSSTEAEAKSLYEQGLEIIQLMLEMTQMEEYLDAYTGNSEIRTIIRDISVGDYSFPKAVYAISITEDDLDTMMELYNPDNVSEELKNLLKKRVCGLLVTQINGRSSGANLAASSICSAGKTFVNENAAENVIYLYTYENAVPVAVTFTIGENQSVSAGGVFVLNDDFTCGSASEIQSFFSDDFTVEVSEILPEK